VVPGGRKRRQQDDNRAEKLRILGNALREFREKAGLSVRKLAERLEVSPTIISRIERNEIKRWPSGDMLNKLAEALDEYADEFRQAVGIVPRETQEILAKSHGFATTLESIHDRFVEMLKAKGLTDKQIDDVMEQATEQTILDVVNEREPLDIAWISGPEEPMDLRESVAHPVLAFAAEPELDFLMEDSSAEEGPSEYLLRNRDAFLPADLADTTHRRDERRKRPPGPESIDAGDAKIVVKRQITGQERQQLEAIAKVIAQLLTK
jgi:transcriptional regulator with XRE-family HTH domain